MENQRANTDNRSRGNSQSGNRSGGPAYEQVAKKAVQQETDYKIDTSNGSSPSVSTTVVGENVTFTQNFNF